jgi:hypothetical protein
MNLISSPSEIEEVATPNSKATGAWRKRLTLREGGAPVALSPGSSVRKLELFLDDLAALGIDLSEVRTF